MKTGGSDSGLNLTHKRFRQLQVRLPPLRTQRQIVAEIEKQFTRLDAGVAALRRVQANLKRYRASVLKAACEGKLIASNIRRAKQVAFSEVINSMKNGIYKDRNAYADDGIACLRMYNIDNGKIIWRDVKRMRLTNDELRDYQLLPGDLLINRVNSRELVGKAAPIPAGMEKCVFESKNIRIRLKRDLVDPLFVGYLLSVLGPSHFDSNAQQVVGMASISQPQIGRLQIPLPPLREQEQIVNEGTRPTIPSKSFQREESFTHKCCRESTRRPLSDANGSRTAA
ncbi:MAG: restriction endonuclease subunit S [Planctomycetes bacterium]|nr:restriction endonuclease subunit S [Planctomycetota bacterium]